MKKIVLILLSIIFCTFNIQAEVVCMKNIKRYKVSATSKVKVKTPQLLTTEDLTCPAGYTQLVEVPSKPTTFIGSWNLAGQGNGSYGAASISFPEPLDSDPSEVIVVQFGTNNGTCTGSSTAPTAPAGVLCIYEGYQSGLRSDFNNRYNAFTPVDDSGSGRSASRFGTALFGYPTIASSFEYYAFGTWAVTKP